jgi:hypothetical protein
MKVKRDCYHYDWHISREQEEQHHRVGSDRRNTTDRTRPERS